MFDPISAQKSLEILDKAASDLSKLGFNNVRVSEAFFAYALRIGMLEEGLSVLTTARLMIDAMEKQSRETQ